MSGRRFGSFVRFGGPIGARGAFGFAGFASAKSASSGTVVVVVVVVVFARAFAVVLFGDFEFSGGFIGSVLRVVVVEIAKLVTSILSSFRALCE